MGFSTSGSLLLLFGALLLATGTAYTATANTVERITDAGEKHHDQRIAVSETAINVTEATYNETSENLTLRIENVGDRPLSVNATDVVVDGTFVDSTDFERATVEGQSTDVWAIQTELVLEDEDTVADRVGTPQRVTVVTGSGVADGLSVEVTR